MGKMNCTMKKMARSMMMMILGGVTLQSVLVGSPYPPQPYPQLDTHPYREPRPPIAVLAGCDKLLSRGCVVTSSDKNLIIGELSYITDGVKTHDASTYVELGPKLQWVQIDLSGECEIHTVCIWHYANLRAYRDVICQISNDPKFIDGVVTVFNNDHDNSAGLGVGKDMEYVETSYGRPFTVDAVQGRYIRCYSNGNTLDRMNHYTEIEVFGKPLYTPQKEDEAKLLPPVPTSEATAKIYDNLPDPPTGKTWLKIDYPRWVW